MRSPRGCGRAATVPESYTWRWCVPGGLPTEGENETPAFHLDHFFNGFGMKSGVIPVPGFICDVVLACSQHWGGLGPPMPLTMFDMHWQFQRATDGAWWGDVRRDFLPIAFEERLIVQGYRLPAFDRFKLYFYWETTFKTVMDKFSFFLTIRTA